MTIDELRQAAITDPSTETIDALIKAVREDERESFARRIKAAL